MYFITYILLFIWLYTTLCTHERVLDGVMLTTGKDLRVFERSIRSALEHLIDINNFYIITPNAANLNKTIGLQLGPRVKFIDELSFPFRYENITDVMYETVKQRGNYVLDDKSPFEHSLYSRTGWFMQQVLKLYAGKILHLKDFMLLDSDLIWFRNISFIASHNTDYPHTRAYYYTSSNQWHTPYYNCLQRVLGFGLPNGADHRSGITHHMVISKVVMESLMSYTEKLHGIPFWKVLLNQSAIELTCRAPNRAICGAGSTLSEYEIYFNYARVKFPQSVVYRPLLWANGPMPGLLFWPPYLESDGPKGNWKAHRQYEVDMILDRQILVDEAQGYDYVGYHGYAKRRYFELVRADRDQLCKNAPQPIPNTTCSWKGYEESGVPMKRWFGDCACYMAMHPSGP